MSPKILEYRGFSIGFFSSDGEERLMSMYTGGLTLARMQSFGLQKTVTNWHTTKGASPIRSYAN